MNQSPFLTSACRSCRHFTPEGRRGGTCQQLGVPVQASWKACALAVPVFSTSWDQLQRLDHWEKALSTLVLSQELDQEMQEIKDLPNLEINVAQSLIA